MSTRLQMRHLFRARSDKTSGFLSNGNYVKELGTAPLARILPALQATRRLSESTIWGAPPKSHTAKTLNTHSISNETHPSEEVKDVRCAHTAAG